MFYKARHMYPIISDVELTLEKLKLDVFIKLIINIIVYVYSKITYRNTSFNIWDGIMSRNINCKCNICRQKTPTNSVADTLSVMNKWIRPNTVTGKRYMSECRGFFIGLLYQPCLYKLTHDKMVFSHPEFNY